MSAFEVPYHKLKFDGKPPSTLFHQRTSDTYRINDVMRQLKIWLEAGNQIFIEFTMGARKGTIGRLDLKVEDMQDLYKTVRTGRGDELELAKKTWNITFDDRPNPIKVEHQGWQHGWPKGAVLRFDVPATVWAYETVAREKKPAAELYDHFGVLLEVGQMVLAPQGLKGSTRTRFAYIKAISAAGTIKIESIKTRQGHAKTESNVSPTIHSYDLIVLDGDMSIKDKVLMAKLANG